MYLRTRQFRTCIPRSGLNNRKLHPSRPAPAFLFTQSYHPTPQSDHNERNGTPKASSVRPITLFAICIPLGYALSWALKSREDVIDADGFIKYTLANKQDVSSTCSIFTLKPTTASAVPTDDPTLERVITSVQFKQPQLQIARSYTLLPPSDAQDGQELRFLIRRERNGEVSGYLHRLPVGSELELRGLSAEYVLPEKVETAVFLAGGTGITPAMQVANALAGEADVHILWANRKREDCAGGVSDTRSSSGTSSGLLNWKQLFGQLPAKVDEEGTASVHRRNVVVEQLETLKDHRAAAPSSSQQKRLLIDYYVDEEGSYVQSEAVRRLLQQYNSQSNSGKKLLFVAGPDGFVNHWAASKMWLNGKEVQGPLGGVLGKMDLSGWEVVKL